MAFSLWAVCLTDLVTPSSAWPFDSFKSILQIVCQKSCIGCLPCVYYAQVVHCPRAYVVVIQAVLVEVDDNDEALEKPVFQCQTCKAVRDDAPAYSGRLQLEFRDSGETLSPYASRAMVKHVTGNRSADAWGLPGSAERLWLRNSLRAWEGKEYTVSINTAPARNGLAFYMSNLVESMPVVKRARH